MSAGRQWIKEIYVGFLLLALSFLYLSHLTAELKAAELAQEISRVKRSGLPLAAAPLNRSISSVPRQLL